MTKQSAAPNLAAGCATAQKSCLLLNPESIFDHHQ